LIRSGLPAAALALLVTQAGAQDLSPHLDRSGRGALDLYRDALLCQAALEILQGTDPLLRPGVEAAGNFAAFLLRTGDVVAENGTVLGPGALAADLSAARALWQELGTTASETQALAEAEAARCLRLYGPESDKTRPGAAPRKDLP